MDLIAGLSGFFVAASLVWIGLLLVVALVLGGAITALFASIFYACSRTARAFERACQEKVS